jgi:poly(glycerol-phosphate) alpha-glucosyltransferase
MLIGSLAAKSGGPAVVVRSLSRRLRQPSRLDLEIFSLQETDSTAPQGWSDDIPLSLTEVQGPRVFGYSPTLSNLLGQRTFDLLHVHGLWMYQSIVALKWARRSGAPYIVSPHGMLDPWALQNSRWKKRIAERLFETAHLRQASCLHALCWQELEAIRAYGLRNPVCVIPNGVEPAAPAASDPQWRSALPKDARILLFFGRIHPKKGLNNLIHAWNKVQNSGTLHGKTWHLVIAGMGSEAYTRELTELVKNRSYGEQVHIVGPQYGDDKSATLQAVDAFILPSVSEGQPMAVLEAWAYSLPALITSACNLHEGFDRRAALRIETDIESIAEGLAQLFGLPPEALRRMGDAGARLAADTFNWSRIAAQYEGVYRWLLGQAERPDNVDVCNGHAKSR